MFNPYTAVKIKNYLKSTSVIKVAIMTISIAQKKHTTIKLTLFVVSKAKWNTKEDTGKSMKNAFYIVKLK